MLEMQFPRHSAFSGPALYATLACVMATAVAVNGYAQLPSAPSAPWTPPAQLKLPAPAEASPLPVDSAQQELSLADLIDIAEQRNPETRVAWETRQRPARPQRHRPRRAVSHAGPAS